MIEIRVFIDGENQSCLQDKIERAYLSEWASFYEKRLGPIRFLPAQNVKLSQNIAEFPEKLASIMNIRNPDILYTLSSSMEIIAGIEITDHSPDGSNADKRYPFLWASAQENVHGFIICPHSKQRPQRNPLKNAQINRFPFRHASRNYKILSMIGADIFHPIQQIVPVRELQAEDVLLPGNLSELVPSVDRIGSYLAHITASKIDPIYAEIGRSAVKEFLVMLKVLAEECMRTTKRVEPSSLFIDQKFNRWIFLYNSRPDSGHWERGEGQFDSIDGRIMFALDEIKFLPDSEKPKNVELWLPQMVFDHPWIKEQISNNYGSKRFRNLMKVLHDSLKVRFAEELSAYDWEILRNNPSLVLERSDWANGIFDLHQYYKEENIDQVATFGEYGLPHSIVEQIIKVLQTPRLYYATYRGYSSNWYEELKNELLKIDMDDSVVLLPRIPKVLIETLINFKGKLMAAEDCGKAELMALRQIYKYKKSMGQ